MPRRRLQSADEWSVPLQIPLAYCRHAMNWLEHHPRYREGGIGIVGFSRGGELALLLGATYRDVRAVVGFVPSGVLWGSAINRFGEQLINPRSWIPGTGRTWRYGHHAAWTLSGRALSYMQPSIHHYLTALLQLARGGEFSRVYAAQSFRRDQAAVDHAAIAAERTRD